MESVVGVSECGSIEVWDARSGALRHSTDLGIASAVKHFKARALAILPALPAYERNLGNACIAVAPEGRSTVSVTEMPGMHEAMRGPLPEAVTSLAFSACGTWACAGAETGRVYLWDVSSGALLAAFQAHLKAVVAIEITVDGAFLCCGSEDAVVSVWNIPSLVSMRLTSQDPIPLQRWSQHMLPITAIACLPGSQRIITASHDRTCKLWSIGLDEPLFSFEFPAGITSLAIDLAQAFFCAGSVDGRIYRVRLVHSVASLRENALLNTCFDEEERHLAPVTSLSINVDSSLLASSSTDGTVRVWHLTAGQCIQTLKNASKAKPYVRCCFSSEFLPAGEQVLAVGHRAKNRKTRALRAWSRVLEDLKHISIISAPVRGAVETKYTEDDFLPQWRLASVC